MITTAKGLTSAYSPMGALIASDRVAEPFLHDKAMFTHGFTFAGHPVRRRRPGQPRHLRARGPARPRAGQGVRVPRRCSRACATSRSSATSAARASSRRSSWSKTRKPRRPSTGEESESLLRGFLSGALYENGLICRADDRGDPVDPALAPADRRLEQFAEIEAILRKVLTEAASRVAKRPPRSRRRSPRRAP